MTDWLIPDDAGQSRGRFVVIEGLDGAGTTTQMTYLARWLTESEVRVETTKEPTAGPFGGIIRQAIDKRIALDPQTLALAFATDRADHVNNSIDGIKSILRRKSWVLCDRYIFSSLAYQAAEGISVDWILAINRAAISPDLTIFVDTHEDVCMERIESRSIRDELFHNREMLKKTRALYGRIIENERLTGKLIVVDGNNKPDDVAAEVRTKVTHWLDTPPIQSAYT